MSIFYFFSSVYKTVKMGAAIRIGVQMPLKLSTITPYLKGSFLPLFFLL